MNDSNLSRRGNIVAGLFREDGNGDRALTEMKAAGFSRVEISQAERDAGDDRDVAAERAVADDRSVPRSTPGTPAAQPFFREHDSVASSFLEELEHLGFSKHDARELVDGLVSGRALVTADTGNDLDRAVAILERNGGDVRYTASDRSATPGTGAAAAAAATTGAVDAAGADRTVRLREEQLVIDKQRINHGEARVRKQTVTEMRTIDVPVTREELVIERRTVGDRESEAIGATPLADQTIRIPLSEEKVTVSKETVVMEEVEIGKRSVTGVERVSDTLRREELTVDADALRDTPTDTTH